MLYELRVRTSPALVPEVVRWLVADGAGGVEERGTALVVYAPTRSEALSRARRLSRAVLALEVEVAPSQAGDWQREWTRWLRPERIAPGIVLQPVSDPTPAPAGTRRLLFEPELVFGVGSHATTRLAARAVAAACSQKKPKHVLDVGTGTGVLAMVAVLSGARHALGIDVDPEAVRSARKNAKLNGLAARCRFSGRALGRLGSKFELTVANVELALLEPLIGHLARVTAPHGTLLVTGVLEVHAERLARRLAAAGLAVRKKRKQGEWALLELGPQTPPRSPKPGKVAREVAPHGRGRRQAARVRRGRGAGSARRGLGR
jgi:ribosomal protein L11 methyltransferase